MCVTFGRIEGGGADVLRQGGATTTVLVLVLPPGRTLAVTLRWLPALAVTLTMADRAVVAPALIAAWRVQDQHLLQGAAVPASALAGERAQALRQIQHDRNHGRGFGGAAVGNLDAELSVPAVGECAGLGEGDSQLGMPRRRRRRRGGAWYRLVPSHDDPAVAGAEPAVAGAPGDEV
jgi:hypothetical protein